MASVLENRPAAVERRARRYRRRSEPGGPQTGDPNLVRYFNDITSYPLLDDATELHMARRIAELQRQEWCACLAHPPVAVVVASVTRERLDGMNGDLEFVKRAHRRWRSCHRRLPSRDRAAYLREVERAAAGLRQMDRDRELLDELESWILGEGASPLPRLRPGRGLDDVRRSLRAARREGRRLRDRFVTSNLRLVISVARKQGRGTLSLSDLIQEGNLGLIKAVQRYDPETGYRFSTYAIWWIRHAITRALADKSRTVRLPVHLVETHKLMNRVRGRLLAQRGREPTDHELAGCMGISMRRLRRLQRQSIDPSYSLDKEVGGEGPYRFVDSVCDESAPSPFEEVLRDAWRGEMDHLLERLPPVEAQVLRWRYGLCQEGELTLKQIGDRYRLSRERIRQLQQQGLWRLRQSLEEPV
jgi:RNA polymerase primary sigma factor